MLDLDHFVVGTDNQDSLLSHPSPDSEARLTMSGSQDSTVKMPYKWHNPQLSNPEYDFGDVYDQEILEKSRQNWPAIPE
jgi:hypothetical protein